MNMETKTEKTEPVQALGMCDGLPKSDGMYVAYVNSKMKGLPYADKKLLMFFGGNWGYPGSAENYRDVVYGYIGPLPALMLEDT